MTDTPAFASFAPGFEFLQGLVKNAGAALPGIGQWVAPTLNPEELDKRIQELRTIQFWLEQNARMLGATIQALEVQKMTLATLQTMNVQMSDLRDSLTIRMPGMAAAHSAAGAAMPPEADDDDDDVDEHVPPLADVPPAETPASGGTAADAATKAAAKPAIDPMQWWGALTQQFGELAAKALKEGAVGLATVPGATVGGLDLGAAGAPGRSPKATAASSATARPRPASAKTASTRARQATPAPTRKAAPRAK